MPDQKTLTPAENLQRLETSPSPESLASEQPSLSPDPEVAQAAGELTAESVGGLTGSLERKAAEALRENPSDSATSSASRSSSHSADDEEDEQKTSLSQVNLQDKEAKPPRSYRASVEKAVKQEIQSVEKAISKIEHKPKKAHMLHQLVSYLRKLQAFVARLRKMTQENLKAIWLKLSRGDKVSDIMSNQD